MQPWTHAVQYEVGDHILIDGEVTTIVDEANSWFTNYNQPVLGSMVYHDGVFSVTTQDGRTIVSSDMTEWTTMPDTCKVFIGGTRTPIHPKLFFQAVESLMDKLPADGREPQVIYGADNSFLDQQIRQYCSDHRLDPIAFPARWKAEGADAGRNRNNHVMSSVDYAILFWDGYSREVPYMLEAAKQYKVKTRLIIFEESPDETFRYRTST